MVSTVEDVVDASRRGGGAVALREQWALAGPGRGDVRTAATAGTAAQAIQRPPSAAAARWQLVAIVTVMATVTVLARRRLVGVGGAHLHPNP